MGIHRDCFRAPSLIGIAALAASAALAPPAMAQAVSIKSCQILSASGSYVLMNNLSGPTNGPCLVVNASFVTIDLNGFQMLGNRNYSAIKTAQSAVTNLSVSNGTLESFASGIVAPGDSAVINEVHVFNSSNIGIHVGQGASITNCIVSGGTMDGIDTGDNALIQGNVVRNNGGRGISAGNSANVSGNSTGSNTGNGIVVGSGSAVTENASASNTIGFVATGPSSFVNDVAHANKAGGFSVPANSSVSSSLSVGNIGDGFDIICPVHVSAATALDNSGTNLSEITPGGAIPCDNFQNQAP